MLETIVFVCFLSSVLWPWNCCVNTVVDKNEQTQGCSTLHSQSQFTSPSKNCRGGKLRTKVWKSCVMILFWKGLIFRISVKQTPFSQPKIWCHKPIKLNKYLKYGGHGILMWCMLYESHALMHPNRWTLPLGLSVPLRTGTCYIRDIFVLFLQNYCALQELLMKMNFKLK